ncbi:hypothetical protein BO71DRAFT_403517 [Aspergillus ellipticus CBS 707.79]|uniref:Xylanolytic transcriptional activator regulatory domain-containing protein n=1 Tax=Aspergillus ellipticus CBS 707.79 TaxID=1448320 RepID=A0A319D301_9EURO|nr:hypothetical protein BO71DRAFT_403517 [Aspergillus ellipticus CBS 707.79]
MMQRLVDRILPDESAVRSGSIDDIRQTSESITTATLDETQIDRLLGPQNAPYSSSSDLTPGSSTWSVLETKEDTMTKQLYALFPSQADVDRITSLSQGTEWMATLFHSQADATAHKIEPSAQITVPQNPTHPTILARTLLRLAICMQHLGPYVDTKHFTSKIPVEQSMVHIISTVSSLVISNDDMIGSLEGLQCVILHGLWLMNAGNLRKAWLTFRRAISVAQLIGIGPGNITSATWDTLESHDRPRSSSVDKTWYIIVASDRYLSLFLGLRIDMRDDSFASEEATKDDSPEEKLEKFHTVISARIGERNLQDTNQAYATTQTIDYDLEAGAKRQGQGWWVNPSLTPCEVPQQMFDCIKRLMLQIHHHGLLIMLHLPYLLRDPAEDRYVYSRLTCIRSSREILPRFIAFRTTVESVYSCRHIDYSGSIAAMTLLLSYLVLGQDSTGRISVTDEQRDEDRRLVCRVKARMEEVALLNQDKLSQESAQIIGQLLPVLAADGGERISLATGADNDTVKLKIPYLGMVKVRVNSQRGLNTTHTASLSLGHEPGAGRSPLDMEELPDNMPIQFEPQNLGDHLDFPSLTAEANDWPFQGVDTNFWSLLHGGMAPEGEEPGLF